MRVILEKFLVCAFFSILYCRCPWKCFWLQKTNSISIYYFCIVGCSSNDIWMACCEICISALLLKCLPMVFSSQVHMKSWKKLWSTCVITAKTNHFKNFLFRSMHFYLVIFAIRWMCHSLMHYSSKLLIVKYSVLFYLSLRRNHFPRFLVLHLKNKLTVATMCYIKIWNDCKHL